MSQSDPFSLNAPTRWTGSVSMIPADSVICGWCGPTFEVVYAQPALFYGGGYGAVTKYRIRYCVCGAIRSVSEATQNPKAYQ